MKFANKHKTNVCSGLFHEWFYKINKYKTENQTFHVTIQNDKR